MGTQTHYPTDLTDNQWEERVKPLLPKLKSGAGMRGRPANDLRRVIDGIVYVTKTGGQQRMLPKDFGCWSHGVRVLLPLQSRGRVEAADGAAQRQGKEASGPTQRALGRVCR